MADNHDHSTETEEETRKRQQRVIEQSLEGKQEGGIWEAIKGFLKFLFETFFGGKEAPEEESTPPRETPSVRQRLGDIVSESRAVPKWQQYMEANKGQPVTFKNPVAGDAVVTSEFDPARLHPIHKTVKAHTGTDLAPRGGTPTPPIVASAPGIVLFSGNKQGYGNTVIIGHANGTYTLYAHMSGQAMPAMGAQVNQGEQIGVMGATGYATGTHLHYEQRKGSEAFAPQIEGKRLTQGLLIAAAKPDKLADLVNRDEHPKLAVENGGKPKALAFVAATTSLGNARQV